MIQRLALLLNRFLYGREDEEVFQQHDYEWQKQKIANVIFLLQVVRSLLSPQDNSQNNTHSAQKAISQSGKDLTPNKDYFSVTCRNGVLAKMYTKILDLLIVWPDVELFLLPEKVLDINSLANLICLNRMENRDPFNISWFFKFD